MRGTFDPGYLNYTLGKLQILKLRKDYEAQEGSNFSLKKFHDEILKHGMPRFVCSAKSCSRTRRSGARYFSRRLQNQIQIAELVPEITARDRFLIGRTNLRRREKRAQQIKMTRLGFVQTREQTIDRPQRVRFRDSQARVAVAGFSLPSAEAIDSSARTTVVPTAITRPPFRRAALIFSAVCSLTKYSSSEAGC